MRIDEVASWFSSEACVMEFSGFIETLLKDSESLANVAKNSYVHPTGFVKIELCGDSEVGTLRLHRWKENANENSDVDIHSHRWTFVSRILEGALLISEYVEDAAGTIDCVRHDCSPNEAGAYQFDKPKASRLKLCSNSRYEAGECYVTSQQTIHKVSIPPATQSATLVLTLPIVRTLSHVFKGASENMLRQPSGAALSKDELSHELLQTIERIRKSRR